jgi:hypothetical protein
MNCKFHLHFLLILSAFLFFNTRKVFSQNPYPYIKKNINNGLNVIIPSGVIIHSSQLSSVESNQKPYSLWVEPGDGNYITDFSAGLSFTPSVIKQSPLLMATKLYERDRRPPPTSGSASRISVFSTDTAVMKSSKLLPGDSIVLFSNVNSVMPLDPMVFAMSYRPSANQAGFVTPVYRVIFRYNIGNRDVFEKIARKDQRHPFPEFSNPASPGSMEINDIRNFANESISVINKPITTREINKDSPETSTADSIVFNVITDSIGTNNIFITLFPNEIDPVNLPPVRLEAVLEVRESAGTGWTSIQKSVLELGMAYAHDPNNITVFPARLPLPQQNRKLHYTINFENTGNGDAKAVKVVFFCPSQMKWDSIAIRASVKASLSEISDFKFQTKDIVFDTIHKRIIFTLDSPGVLIEGISPGRLPVISNHRMGKIEFDLPALAEANPDLSTTIEAWADIYFKGQTPSPDSVSDGMIRSGRCLPGTKSYEFPVRTLNATAIYYKCDNQPPCNCQNPRGLWRRLGCAWKAMFH